MQVAVDASDTMVALGEVAVWSFDLAVWGECAQAATESAALAGFARRVGVPPDRLEPGERAVGPDAVFPQDLLSATDAQVDRTLEILQAQRTRMRGLLIGVTDAELDAEDPEVAQPAWMPWRTPRAILRHIADTESRAYPRWCGLPALGPVADLCDELEQSAAHVRRVVTTMPRSFRAEHRGELWTPVKLLRRLAWHERVELVFLRRRLEAARCELT